MSTINGAIASILGGVLAVAGASFLAVEYRTPVMVLGILAIAAGALWLIVAGGQRAYRLARRVNARSPDIYVEKVHFKDQMLVDFQNQLVGAATFAYVRVRNRAKKPGDDTDAKRCVAYLTFYDDDRKIIGFAGRWAGTKQKFEVAFPTDVERQVTIKARESHDLDSMMKRFSEDNARGYHNDMDEEAAGEFRPGHYWLRVDVDGQNFDAITTWVRLEHGGAGHAITGELVPTPRLTQRLRWRLARGVPAPTQMLSYADDDANALGQEVGDGLMELNELSQAILGEPVGTALAPTNPDMEQNGRLVRDGRFVLHAEPAMRTRLMHVARSTLSDSTPHEHEAVILDASEAAMRLGLTVEFGRVLESMGDERFCRWVATTGF